MSVLPWRVFYYITEVGTNNITVPVDTPLSRFTHFLIYTKSSLVEQTTPFEHLIYDAWASVSSIEFTDKDMDVDELGMGLRLLLARRTPPAHGHMGAQAHGRIGPMVHESHPLQGHKAMFATR